MLRIEISFFFATFIERNRHWVQLYRRNKVDKKRKKKQRKIARKREWESKRANRYINSQYHFIKPLFCVSFYEREAIEVCASCLREYSIPTFPAFSPSSSFLVLVPCLLSVLPPSSFPIPDILTRETDARAYNARYPQSYWREASDVVPGARTHARARIHTYIMAKRPFLWHEWKRVRAEWREKK